MNDIFTVGQQKSLTVYDAAELFWDHLKELKRSEATTNTYRKNLDKFFRYLSSYYNYKVYVDDVSAGDLERYLYDELSSKEYSSAYRFNIITAFKCFYGFCYKKGYCKINVAKQITQVKRRVKERVYLTDSEVQKLLDVIEHPLINAVVSTMYYTGLRINECINLKDEDANFDRNCIIVRGDKEKYTREIPMNQKLKDKLTEYCVNVCERKDNKVFFATRTGSLSANYTNLLIKEACRKANINKKVTCHILRHSFASNLVLKGADIGQVQKLLGHWDLKSTEIYLHANIDELRNTVSLMG